jgi:hypothetical protein
MRCTRRFSDVSGWVQRQWRCVIRAPVDVSQTLELLYDQRATKTFSPSRILFPLTCSSHAAHDGVAADLHQCAGPVRSIFVKSIERIIESADVFEHVEQLDGDTTAQNQ